MIQLLQGGDVQTKEPNKTDTLCHKIQFQLYYLPKEMHGSKGLTLSATSDLLVTAGFR